jgi:hypothetical protein
VRKLLTFIVVLGLLLVLADRVAWWVAERGVATAIQESENLPQRPGVSIGGFPFLTQAIEGVYREVDVTFQDVPAAEGVTVDELHADLEGDHVPLEAIVNRTVESAPVDRAAATGRVGFASLNTATERQLQSDELTITYGSAAGADRLAFTGTYDGIAGNLQLKGEARLIVQDGSLVVTVLPDTLNVPQVVRDTVARLLGISYQVPDLPFGFQVRSVAVGQDGVTVTATAEDVVLGPVEDTSGAARTLN